MIIKNIGDIYSINRDIGQPHDWDCWDFSGFGKWYITSRFLIHVVMEQYMSAEALKTPMLRKFQQVRVKLDHVLFCFLLIFLFLFLRDHIRLTKVQKILKAFENEEIPENHLLMMERRKRRLEEQCTKFNGEKKLENSPRRWVNNFVWLLPHSGPIIIDGLSHVYS